LAFSFNHIIGKSTLAQGFTIPKSAYSYISLPEKGEKRIITLVYAKNRRTQVLLRRLNNSPGHVQIRYDGKTGLQFRQWLLESFSEIENENLNKINNSLNIIIINDDTWEITTSTTHKRNTLYFTDIRVQNIRENHLLSLEQFAEITSSVRNIDFIQEKRQDYYNDKICKELSTKGWLKEQKIVEEDPNIRLKCDFRKDMWQLEVEFGNARTYYQDIVKFAISYSAGLMKIGGLIVPDYLFANHLCQLGKKNAIENRSSPSAQYSGMIHFNKVVNEFEYIKRIFRIPFFIAAVAVSKPCTVIR
jgi:hypothetical protein